MTKAKDYEHLQRGLLGLARQAFCVAVVDEYFGSKRKKEYNTLFQAFTQQLADNIAEDLDSSVDRLLIIATNPEQKGLGVANTKIHRVDWVGENPEIDKAHGRHWFFWLPSDSQLGCELYHVRPSFSVDEIIRAQDVIQKSTQVANLLEAAEERQLWRVNYYDYGAAQYHVAQAVVRRLKELLTFDPPERFPSPFSAEQVELDLGLVNPFAAFSRYREMASKGVFLSPDDVVGAMPEHHARKLVSTIARIMPESRSVVDVWSAPGGVAVAFAQTGFQVTALEPDRTRHSTICRLADFMKCANGVSVHTLDESNPHLPEADILHLDPPWDVSRCIAPDLDEFPHDAGVSGERALDNYLNQWRGHIVIHTPNDVTKEKIEGALDARGLSTVPLCFSRDDYTVLGIRNRT